VHSSYHQIALRHILFPRLTYVYAFYILHVISGTVSCLQSAPPRSRKCYDIVARGEKRRKAGTTLCRSSRSLPKSRRKERALALCKVTYIAARARETEGNARIVLATRIFAMVHRSCRPCSRFVSRERRRERSCR